MAIKDILVHVDGSDMCRHRVDAAIALARRQDASVTGVSLALESTLSRYLSIDVPSGLSEAEQAARRQAAVDVAGRFEATAKAAGVRATSTIVTAGATKAPARLAFHARHADICFLGQPDPDDAAPFHEALLDAVLFASGRPVYIVPRIGRFEMKHRKAVIAWDGGRKAARAVNDAIPLLQGRGGEVVVLVINADERRGAHGDQPGADIAAHLTRHGITAKIVRQVVKEIPVDSAILNYAADEGADLLVMGAYGHSRLLEKAFGGVTNAILQQMTVPVLMAE